VETQHGDTHGYHDIRTPPRKLSFSCPFGISSNQNTFSASAS
jgi:hypothetical protein